MYFVSFTIFTKLITIKFIKEDFYFVVKTKLL